jgi:hypothetical protein
MLHLPTPFSSNTCTLPKGDALWVTVLLFISWKLCRFGYLSTDLVSLKLRCIKADIWCEWARGRRQAAA